MKFAKVIAASLALAAVLGTTVVSSAEAKSFKSLLNSVTGRGNSFYNQNNNAALSALSNTAATLQGMIQNGVATGRITGAQAANFQAQLGQIGDLQANFMADGSLSGSEIQNLTQQFTSLTTQVNGALSVGINGQFYNPYGNAVPYNYNTNYSPYGGYQYNTNTYGRYNSWF
jgi:hypothetical protein